MKKVLALILTLAMVMAMAITAMAVDLTPPGDFASGNTDTGEVQIKVVDTSDTIVYKIDVDWESLQFTYTFGAWDTTTHTYVAGSWDKTQATITIENHSNAPVNFSAQIEGKLAHTDSTNGVTSTLAQGTVAAADGSITADANSVNGTLNSADAAAYRNLAGPKATILLNISDTTPSVFNTSGNFVDVGTITVTISKP